MLLWRGRGLLARCIVMLIDSRFICKFFSCSCLQRKCGTLFKKGRVQTGLSNRCSCSLKPDPEAGALSGKARLRGQRKANRKEAVFGDSVVFSVSMQAGLWWCDTELSSGNGC